MKWASSRSGVDSAAGNECNIEDKPRRYSITEFLRGGPNEIFPA
jgi:hypothetical protein